MTKEKEKLIIYKGVIKEMRSFRLGRHLQALLMILHLMSRHLVDKLEAASVLMC